MIFWLLIILKTNFNKAKNTQSRPFILFIVFIVRIIKNMKITEKLTKPITEVNYLRAENVDRYRLIIRFFFEQYEKINYWLYKEDVYEALKQTNLFPDYTMEMCQSDLQALLEWKNLIAMQDSSKVSTIEEFRNRKFRYQLSEYTIEIERMTIRLENIEVEGASLEPTLLERIHTLILQIPSLMEQEDEKVNLWWTDLNENFIRLNRNYQDYLRTLNSSKAEEMMKTQSFLIYKEKIIMYLRNFVKGLQEQAMILEDYMKDIPIERIEAILKKAVAYEMTIPRLDVQIKEEEIYDLWLGRWQSIYDWFVGSDGQIHPGWAGFYHSWEALNVNMDNLLAIQGIVSQQKVYIVENPSIFQALLKRIKEKKIEDFALICTNGQLNYSAYLLLDLIQKAHIPMYYCGDMDPEGLLIAQRLCNRYPSLHLWHYEISDYKAALSNQKASEKRMAMTKQLKEKKLLQIAQEMQKNRNQIAYQENILDRYLDDLKG